MASAMFRHVARRRAAARAVGGISVAFAGLSFPVLCRGALLERYSVVDNGRRLRVRCMLLRAGRGGCPLFFARAPRGRHKSIEIPMDSDNAMCMSELRIAIESCFRMRIKVACITLTMGSTDAFAVDDVRCCVHGARRAAGSVITSVIFVEMQVAAAVAIRDELCVKYNQSVGGCCGLGLRPRALRTTALLGC